MLLDDGIIKTLQVFQACAIFNEQDRRITKATVEPPLEQAAARIADVVEAEQPVNHPTLKGIIHVDVEKMTEELRRRVKSLEAKLEETKSNLKLKASTSRDTATLHKKKAKNAEGDGMKSNKTPGNAVARSTAIPNKNKKWKSNKTPGNAVVIPNKNKKWKGKRATTNPESPDSNDNASTSAKKKPWKKATGRKSGGRREENQTAEPG